MQHDGQDQEKNKRKGKKGEEAHQLRLLLLAPVAPAEAEPRAGGSLPAPRRGDGGLPSRLLPAGMPLTAALNLPEPHFPQFSLSPGALGQAGAGRTRSLSRRARRVTQRVAGDKNNWGLSAARPRSSEGLPGRKALLFATKLSL